ncbi:MAG: hypothetical protein KQJ78_03395 [Deltaproteobacteria bacterium]|nr:hypothetical protein [Deltaproteobacteria bacterium]
MIPAPPREAPAWLIPGLGVLLFLLLADALLRTQADPDLWGYLAFGRLFWQNPGFPYHDVFAYPPTDPTWVYHEWLTGVVFWPVYQALGGAGLQLLKYLAALGAAWLVWLTARGRGASPAWCSAGTMLLAVAFAAGYNPVRAQVFTYLFFALYVYLMDRAARERRPWLLAWLPPVMVLWANFHGGFVAGLGIIGLFAAGQLLERRPWLPLALALAAAAAATLANPYGLDYWRFILGAVSLPRPEIGEWRSVAAALSRGEAPGGHIAFIIIFLWTMLLTLWRRTWAWTDYLLLAFTAYLGFKHVRHEVFLILLAGAFLPLRLAELGPRLASHPGARRLGEAARGATGALLLAGAIVMSALPLLSAQPLALETRPQDPTRPGEFYYPVAALDYLKAQGLQGDILPHFGWGEYLLFNLYPGCRVGMDGRYETVYPAAYCLAYFDFLNGRPGWREFLQKFPPQLILVKSPTPIVQLLAREPGWRLALDQGGAALFLRQGFP